MPRRLRDASGGYVYHALNRAVGRGTIFDKAGDYEAFEKVLGQAVDFVPMRLLAYCLMPNHWHLVLWPRRDEDLSEYMRWLTVTHTQRWHAHHHTAGTGPIYQGRFKSFPVQEDEHFLAVCRYVERNALRARLVKKAEIGAGQACGGGSKAAYPGWTPGRWRHRLAGWATSIAPRPRRSWKRCGGRWCVARPMAIRPGKRGRQSAWASSLRCDGAAGRLRRRVRKSHNKDSRPDSRPLFFSSTCTSIVPMPRNRS
jgi:REP element-mobilizing transposase RayT